MNAFLKQAKELQGEIQAAIGAKAATGGSINQNDDSTKRIIEDLEKNKVRDEDGEFHATKGLDNRMLI